MLNPRMFNSKILNPRMLCPRILNPRILNPRILNPRILNPRILNAKFFFFLISIFLGYLIIGFRITEGEGNPSFKVQGESFNTEMKCKAKEGVSFEEAHLRVFCNWFGIQAELEEAGQRLSM